MKKTLAVLFLCLGFLLCISAVAATDITDTNGHWAQVHIEKWINDGLIAGYPDGQFKPDNSITRAEFVSLVNRAFKIKNNDSTGNFNDVESADWFYDDVISAQAAGYISGYPDGTFKPNNPVTRQEAAVMINRLLGLETAAGDDVELFRDNTSFASWARPSIERVAARGIMSGFPDKTFGPLKNITRAETVVTLDNALAYSQEGSSEINGMVRIDNQPVGAVTVKIFAKDSPELLKEIITGQDGTFSFSLPDGKYEITALKGKNVGYKEITVIEGNAPGDQVIVLSEGAQVSGKLVDNQGKPLANVPLVFWTNPSFAGRTDNNGTFSVVLPIWGNNGQLLSYSAVYIYEGTRTTFMTNQQFNGDTNLGQIHTNIPRDTNSGGGGGGPSRDTTPPVWSTAYPKADDLSSDGFKLYFKTNENGKVYYVVLADAAAAPSAAEVKNGTGSGGAAVIAKGQQNLQAGTEISAAITGLAADTAYDIYVVAEDTVPNLQAAPVKLEITTRALDPGDITPPVWSPGYPKADDLSSDWFKLYFKANENGKVYYVVLTDAAAAPSAAEVKNGTGNGGAAVITKGQQNLQADTEISTTVAGLDADTAYDIYVVAEDTVLNLQAVPAKLDVATIALSDNLPPVLNSASINGSTLVLVFNETLNPISVPQSSDFNVEINNVAAEITDVSITGVQIIINLAVAAVHGDTATISYNGNSIQDKAGNAAKAFSNPITNNTGLLVAPPNDPTVVTSFLDSTAFLYSGDSPVQTNLAPDTVEENRVAVLRGRVLSRDNTPLSGVKITVVNHDEFGETFSREDGFFDMAVNGGGNLTLRYEKKGYITAQRQENVPWQNFTCFPDVVLIPYDTKENKVTLTKESPIQVAQGSQVEDADGKRQATLIIPAGVTAQKEDGSPISNLTIRATEYTVGDNGPQAMPAELPPNVGYTYCIEYSADEAENVRFSEPIFHYVENFIGAPVGGIVPMGYYDYDKAAWIPSENGRVIKITGINEGMAELDTVGSQVGVEPLNITDEEKRKLAELYGDKVGVELWRVPITHFTPWDCNWPYGPPEGVKPPNLPKPKVNDIFDPCTGRGSIIEYQTQVLGETAKVYGTPFTLNYSSSRVEGNKYIRTLAIPISTSSDLHKDLKRIDLEISVAGQFITKSFPAKPEQTYAFIWDGKDAYGRSVQGATTAHIRIGYVYPAIYNNPIPSDISFGQNGTSPAGGWSSNRENLEVTIWQESDALLSSLNTTATGLGGWSLNIHHSYDPYTQMLNLGDGSRRMTSGYGISTVAGNGTPGYSGDNGPATEAELYEPGNVAVGPDGCIYIADQVKHRIRRVDRDGIITTIAGTGVSGFSGDGGPAYLAQMDEPWGIAVAPDNSIYFADHTNHRIRRVDTNGIITTVVGPGDPRKSDDGLSALEAFIYRPMGIALGADGSLFISDMTERILRVGPDGIVTTLAGKNGYYGYSGDGGPAREALLNTPQGLAVGKDGSLYVADMQNNCIRKIGIDGIITTVAGNGISGFSGDGGPANEAQLSYPRGIAIDFVDGSLYIADAGNNRIRRIGTDGIITTVVGNGVTDAEGFGGYSGDGESPLLAQLNNPTDVAIGPGGNYYIADELNRRIRQVGQPTPGIITGGVVIPAQDGTELYIFDESGRHLRSINALTGNDIFNFSYDEQGRLIEVEDAFGNITSIQRDAEGNPTAIIAPGGQTTYLEVNENGYLSSIACPLLKKTDLEYTEDGLLTKFIDHKDNVHSFTYDELGRLIKDEDPAGGYTELSRSELGNGFNVEVKTAQGRISNYKVEYLSNADIRRVNTDPLGGITETLIKADGTSEITYPDGTKVTMVQGPDPRPGLGIMAPITRKVTVTTPEGLTSTVTRERMIEPADTFDLFSISKITDIINANGKEYRLTYDISTNDEDKTVTITDVTPEKRVAINILDQYGRLTEETIGTLAGETVVSLEPIKYSYDEKGRLTDVEQKDQHIIYTYDDMNRITALEDASGSKYQYKYNGADLLTELIMPEGQSYKFSYDANGNVNKITMPSGGVHALDYTVLDQPLSYSPPANGSYQKSYNLDREVTNLTLPSGREVQYQYDDSGRVTGMLYDSVTATFGYSDNTDRVSTITRDPDGISYEFEYDGALPTAMIVTGLMNDSYSYEYNNDFNLIKSTLGTDDIIFKFDLDGRVIQYGTFDITRDDPFGLPTQISDGILTIDYEYDNFGRLIDRTHKVNNQQMYQLGLRYDNTGLIEQKTENMASDTLELNYDYDANKQLVSITGDKAESYTYDENGNRLSHGAEYDAQDRLTEMGGIAYQFNDEGYLTQRGNDSFEYTAQGELVRATLESGSEITYTYDGIGRRVERWIKDNGEETPTLTEQYLYGNPGNPFEITAVRDSEGILSQYFYDQVNCLFAINKGSDWFYVATDQLGSPRVVSDADGNIVKTIEYDSFGKLISDSNLDFKLPIGYAGGIADQDTKLVHFGMRDYDPAAGRWTARDPIFFNGQQGNLYVYVSNNPVNLKDPYGLFCIGGSVYSGVGIGGQLCITGEGVSVCGEVGFGIGGGIDIAPMGGLANTGTTVGAQAEATFYGIGPSAALTLDSCGSLQFTSAIKVGPFSQSFNYDFLEGKWSTGDLSVGGEKADMNKSWADSFKPKVSANAKVYGQGCIRF
ncbi:MAG: S-layer homology domain-containing protein [Syntrophomonadaceae bacterium]|jgi:RHS repeat-associated protein/uncharacterized repeat protein (TIGR02059 family)